MREVWRYKTHKLSYIYTVMVPIRVSSRKVGKSYERHEYYMYVQIAGIISHVSRITAFLGGRNVK